MDGADPLVSPAWLEARLAVADTLAIDGRVLSRLGVAPETTLVVYGEDPEMAVHQVWWVRDASGHLDVRVLARGRRLVC